MFTNSDVDKDKPSSTTSTMLKNINDTSYNKLIENDISDDLSQLNQAQCEYLINLFNKNKNADINTQDEELVINIVKKNMKYIFPSNKEEIEINTQQFMDLNINRIAQQLQKSLLNFSKIQTNSDNSVVSVTSINNTLKNPEQSKKNCLTFNTLMKPKKNKKFSFTDLELSDEDLNSELLNQDQDPEIITFRSMCETMKNVIQVNKDDCNSKDIINYRVNSLVIKQLSAEVISCVNYKDSAPSGNCLNDTEQNFSVTKHMEIKKRQYHDLTNDSSDESSSKSYSNKIIGKFNASKKNVIDETLGDNDDCVIIENKSSKVKNYKKKKLNINSSQQNKHSKEIKPIYYCLPDGMIHKDMLDYFNSNNI